ncbi:MAG TPA: hypothetical protein VEY30_10920 [Myxococcaceae bacterium]|nr:hypothetical protein [Myxococcaceae bacterium]
MTSGAFCLSVISGCAASHTLLSPEDRSAIERQLTSQPTHYLKLSYYVTPFFGDASKKLLTALPPEDLRLLENPNGTPINPGQIETILPAGTRARLTRVEFPTAFVVADRMLYTPRTQTWVYLEVEGWARDRPLILVLRPQINSRKEFSTELERYLSDRDPSTKLEEWPEFIRSAVKTKSAVESMPAEALEMAWGYPEIKRLSFDGPVRKEEWVYAGERRKAYVANGRLERTAHVPAPSEAR